MNKRIAPICIALGLLALPVCATGCSQEVSSSKKTTVDKDGTVKSEESKVTKGPDGSVTKEETSKKTSPPKAP